MAQTPGNAIKQRSRTSLGGMDEVQKVFNKFDTNGDGKISVSELRSVFKALGVDVGTSSGDLTNAVTEIDKDGDGAIGLEEFADFHRGGGGGSSGGESNNGKAIGDAFEMYDRDRNGLISAQELHEVMKGLGESCTEQDCARMIGSVDVDGDGCVDFEEFKKMMRP